MKLKPFKLFIWIIIIFGIYFYYNFSNFENKKIITQEKYITIKHGETLNNFGKKLGLTSLKDKIFYKLYIKYYTPKNFSFQAGKYKLEKNSTIKDIFKSLNKSIENSIKITILEGWNIFDIDEILTKKSLINKGDFIQKTQNFDKNLIKKYIFLKEAKTLEGFLYPDTYEINPNNFKIENFIEKMLDNFEKKVYQKYLKNYSAKEILEIINLASIVEKEEKSKKNKPIVANILKKRYKQGWQIGADITVCYPHHLTSKECKMVVSKYINEKSDYNTRTKIGLPKTPISNPNDETIEATINDKKTPYYFYLHNVKTGEIYYAKTNKEHEANKRFMR